MGNRCVITTKERELGVYLHWNGGYDSVRAFLKYCELQDYRPPEKDSYGWARLCQVLGNFFEGNLNVGVHAYTTDEQEDPGDNGIFIIENWKVVYNISDMFVGSEPVVKTVEELEEAYKDGYDLQEFLEDIDKNMPENCRLGNFMKAKRIPISEIQEGQIVFSRGYNKWIEKPCLGIGKGKAGGWDVDGLPFADFLDKLERYERWGIVHEPETIEAVIDNPNSYIGLHSKDGMCWAIPIEK